MEGCDILDVAATQPASEPAAATAPVASAPEPSEAAQEPPAAAATAGPSGGLHVSWTPQKTKRNDVLARHSA